jgi:hypothetical protein
MTILLNGLRAVSARLFQPWRGAWSAEVDFDLGVAPVVPSGPAILKIGNAILTGTIDPDASGRFGEKAKARIIGGSGGWHRNVSARHFHNDAGVTSLAVITATAAEIQEPVVVAVPSFLGVDYVRCAGPASSVLAGLDWYVTAAGVTTVGPRVTLPATPDIDILDWDPFEQKAELASDSIIAPGTILVDPRFGSAVVRDVEQIFTDGKARATAWCSEDKPTMGKLAGLLASAVKGFGGIANLKTYRYRVLAQDGLGRLTLQAVSRTVGAPDSIAVPPWFGIPGVSATIVPGTECAVQFLDGDPAQPVITAFKGEVVQLKIGEGASPAALAALVATELGKLKTAIQNAAVVPNDGGASFKAALVTALAEWPAPVASSKLFTD